MPAPPSHAVLAQAAHWYARLHSQHAGDRDRARWREWLDAAPAHQAAWREVEDIGRSFSTLRDAPDPQLAAGKLLEADARMRQRRRRALLGMAGLAGTGLLGAALWRGAPLPQRMLAWRADHRNGTGAPREVLLADGTRVWLNAASAFDVHFTTDARRLALREGELFITTALAVDPGREFVVTTAHGRLRALGTRFNVRQQPGETQVAVYEGAVEIRTGASDARAIVRAGEQAGFTREAIAPPTPADPARQAWTGGVLLAHDMTLRDFVQELRRYRPGHIGLADEVAQLRVYGSFPAYDSDRALAMLAGALPVRVHRPLPWWVSIEPRR